jgi:hypothetical protein
MRGGKLAGIIPGVGATEEQVMLLAAGVSESQQAADAKNEGLLVAGRRAVKMNKTAAKRMGLSMVSPPG